jgi:hypothetical protein
MKTYWYKEVEAFYGIGTSSYFGDVGGADSKIIGWKAAFDHFDIDLWQTRVALTGGARIMPKPFLAISAQLSPIFLSGNDARSNYADRGYSFNTSIVELSAQVEYYIANRMTGFAPFVAGGVGGMVYGYKSNAMDKRKWDTGTTFILGLGTRFPETRRITHSLDFTFHFTTTDYLDGFHTDRNSPDLFFLISYKINFNVFTLLTYDYRGRVK